MLKRTLISFVEYDKPCTRAQLSRRTKEAQKTYFFHINKLSSKTAGLPVLMVCSWPPEGQVVCTHELFILQFYTFSLSLFGELLVPSLSSVYHLNSLDIEDTICV